MNPQFIIDKIKNGNVSNEKILSWLNAMPNPLPKLKPIEYKIGDVFMHNVFHHPYVLLEKKGDMWLCGLLTSEESCTEILCEVKSRFLINSYFTRALFTVVIPQGSFYGVYDNKRHLSSVLKKLKKMMS
jgi:hypothetical protein